MLELQLVHDEEKEDHVHDNDDNHVHDNDDNDEEKEDLVHDNDDNAHLNLSAKSFSFYFFCY